MRMHCLVILVFLPTLSCGGEGNAPGTDGDEPGAGTGRFISSGVGVLSDTQTGILWQQIDDNVRRNWVDAVAYCQSLTLDDLDGWQLPEIDDLFEIVDTQFTPTIDPAFFGVKSSSYWSSTPSFAENIAWSVNFHDGLKSNAMLQSTLFYCRCMRKE